MSNYCNHQNRVETKRVKINGSEEVLAFLFIFFFNQCPQRACINRRCNKNHSISRNLNEGVRMSERLSEKEAEVLKLGMQASTLVSSFIYSGITLLLLGLENPSMFVWQVALFALQIAFALLLFDTYITFLFASQVMWKRVPPKPLYVANIFHVIGLFVWMMSISLMFFARNLTFLGVTQALITLVGLPLLGFALEKSRKRESKG